MMTGPRTEAGKRLLAVWLEGRTHPPSTQRRLDFEELVLAIEAEAEARADVDGLVALLDEAERTATQTFNLGHSPEMWWQGAVATVAWLRGALLAGDKAEAPRWTLDEYMCPNCVTPWKCNGPHFPVGDKAEAPEMGTS